MKNINIQIKELKKGLWIAEVNGQRLGWEYSLEKILERLADDADEIKEIAK